MFNKPLKRFCVNPPIFIAYGLNRGLWFANVGLLMVLTISLNYFNFIFGQVVKLVN
jgi:hypothetical protein